MFSKFDGKYEKERKERKEREREGGMGGTLLLVRVLHEGIAITGPKCSLHLKFK